METKDYISEIERLKFEIDNLKKDYDNCIKESEIYKSTHNNILLRIYNIIDDYKDKFIDFFVSIFFVLSIILVSYFSGKELLNVYNNNDSLLKVVEEFFLVMIPIFILIGFYIYYLIMYRAIMFASQEVNKELKKFATKSIQLTKTLFLSSIMSYTIIKIIEKLFVYNQEIHFKELISYGVLLLLLMSYLIITHNMDRKEK